MTRAVKERLNLYLTKAVADELRRLVPARERTRFVDRHRPPQALPHTRTDHLPNR